MLSQILQMRQITGFYPPAKFVKSAGVFFITKTIFPQISRITQMHFA